MLAPIVLFVYNRPVHTQRLLDSLTSNPLISQSDVYVYCDGAKANSSDETSKNIAAVRALVKNYKAARQITVVEKSQNYGLANSVVEGVTTVIKKHGKAIVLEDDLQLSSGFLKYMNDALELYQTDDQVMQISGYWYPCQEKCDDTFFLKLCSSWGWATWERAWAHFNPSAQDLLSQFNFGKKRIFDYNFSYNFHRMLTKSAANRNDSWAIRWYASMFLLDGLTLFPSLSLVNNTGNDDSGVHSYSTNAYNNSKLLTEINLTKQPIVESKKARHALTKYFITIKFKMLPNYLVYLFKKQFFKAAN